MLSLCVWRTNDLLIAYLCWADDGGEIWRGSDTLTCLMQMSMHDCVFYYWSDEQWDSCDKFREAATPILNPDGVPNLLDWRASGTQVWHSMLCVCLGYPWSFIGQYLMPSLLACSCLVQNGG